ncbi:phage tail protein [Vibrio sp. 10N.286.49.C2]|uniref:DUF3319 domain-containing protein n=1 Tax=unclassified Vibrio TaxID=2614977 RepID=UPI000C84195E|nr:MULTISPECIES: DUF3319 domain-containing protein [unclassified Vibrio]PMH38302.1 phage tail protein [Vibrio sp. 10N.286.49.C2]PMH55710.1 phage tail protein [Vibrio sp. 10N.286.49.B1]PMH79287.1 phage tail protein [Vibrio sp. 10N.286.48.B7]
MALASYRGFPLKSVGTENQVWKVSIKNRELKGSLSAIKKSVDWWCDTASIIDPSQLAASSQRADKPGSQEVFQGYTIKNDTGEINAWYCMFNGKLIKGGKLAIQKHIEAYLIAKKKAEQIKK